MECRKNCFCVITFDSSIMFLSTMRANFLKTITIACSYFSVIHRNKSYISDNKKIVDPKKYCFIWLLNKINLVHEIFHVKCKTVTSIELLKSVFDKNICCKLKLILFCEYNSTQQCLTPVKICFPWECMSAFECVWQRERERE